jgi:DNA-binding transcriptional LysR family regulator
LHGLARLGRDPAGPRWGRRDSRAGLGSAGERRPRRAPEAYSRSGPVELRELRYFVAAAEELHFTRAAKRLHIAQQALSSAIKQLEARLGTPLFERTTRRVRLTGAGAALLPKAKQPLSRPSMPPPSRAPRQAGRRDSSRSGCPTPRTRSALLLWLL